MYVSLVSSLITFHFFSSLFTFSYHSSLFLITFSHQFSIFLVTFHFFSSLFTFSHHFSLVTTFSHHFFYSRDRTLDCAVSAAENQNVPYTKPSNVRSRTIFRGLVRKRKLLLQFQCHLPLISWLRFELP